MMGRPIGHHTSPAFLTRFGPRHVAPPGCLTTPEVRGVPVLLEVSGTAWLLSYTSTKCPHAQRHRLVTAVYPPSIYLAPIWHLPGTYLAPT